MVVLGSDPWAAPSYELGDNVLFPHLAKVARAGGQKILSFRQSKSANLCLKWTKNTIGGRGEQGVVMRRWKEGKGVKKEQCFII